MAKRTQTVCRQQLSECQRQFVCGHGISADSQPLV